MVRTSLFAALMVTAVSGCAQVTDIGGASYLTSEPVIQMTSSGIGPIGAGTPYSREGIGQALPGFELGNVTTMSEGEVRQFLAAFKGGMQQLQFEPGGPNGLIGRVHLVGQEAAGPNGERIGMTYAESGGRALDCTAGSGDWTGMAICKTSDQRLAYVYAPEGYTGPDGQLPPRDVLVKSRLVRIIWNSPS